AITQLSPQIKKTVFKTTVKDPSSNAGTATKSGLANSIHTGLAHKEHLSQEEYDESLQAARSVFVQTLGKFSEENEVDTAYGLEWLMSAMKTKESFDQAKKVKGFKDLAGVFSSKKEVMDNKPALSSAEKTDTTATKGIGRLPMFNLPTKGSAGTGGKVK